MEGFKVEVENIGNNTTKITTFCKELLLNTVFYSRHSVKSKFNQFLS